MIEPVRAPETDGRVSGRDVQAGRGGREITPSGDIDIDEGQAEQGRRILHAIDRY